MSEEVRYNPVKYPQGVSFMRIYARTLCPTVAVLGYLRERLVWNISYDVLAVCWSLWLWLWGRTPLQHLSTKKFRSGGVPFCPTPHWIGVPGERERESEWKRGRGSQSTASPLRPTLSSNTTSSTLTTLNYILRNHNLLPPGVSGGFFSDSLRD